MRIRMVTVLLDRFTTNFFVVLIYSSNIIFVTSEIFCHFCPIKYLNIVSTVNCNYFILGQVYNFNKYKTTTIDSLGFPYDFKSIMHYQKYAFSKQYGRLVTIQTLNPAMQDVIGNGKGLSEGIGFLQHPLKLSVILRSIIAYIILYFEGSAN